MNEYDELNKPYPMTNVDMAKGTKEKILLESTIMFALKGYAAVSMRDIAKKVDIKVASLYNHFKSKEDLWHASLENIEKLYLMYFKRLENATDRASNFTEMLEFMFAELYDIVNIFTYYGFSLVITEQFTDEHAYKICSEIFLKYSIDFIKQRFDKAVLLGFCKEFDTGTTATCFMHSVLFGIMMRANQDIGRELPYDVDKMFQQLHDYILELAIS